MFVAEPADGCKDFFLRDGVVEVSMGAGIAAGLAKGRKWPQRHGGTEEQGKVEGIGEKLLTRGSAGRQGSPHTNMTREASMPFFLSRGGKNVIAEVQRWQHFLLTQAINQVGAIDGDFGQNSELGTKFFQVSAGVTATGKLDEKTLQAAVARGYGVVPDDYYTSRAGDGFPKKPAKLNSPSDDSRATDFGCFRFLQLAMRPDAEAIVIKGSCDGSVADWTAANIVQIPVPQLRFAVGFRGTVRCHAKAAPVMQALFAQWEKDNLLHLIRSYEGCFVPRYKRKQASPMGVGHGLKQSSEVTALSNHSFGSAFDINFPDNQLGVVPAFCGERGSVRELVASANAVGVYWGGHFGNRDGMHFEISKLG